MLQCRPELYPWNIRMFCASDFFLKNLEISIWPAKTKIKFYRNLFVCGPCSSVGIATDYGLDGPGIESFSLSVFRLIPEQFQTNKVHDTSKNRAKKKIPVGTRFFAHVQTGPGAHPASCTMGTWSFPGVKRPGRGADHPPLPSAEVENE
jgi:hypothetical protein